MNILIVTQYFWPETFRINDFAVSLYERGHRVTVLTGIPNYPEGRFYPGYGILKRWREKYQGINVLRAPLIRRGKSSAIRLALNYLSFAFMASVVAVIRCREKFDIVLVYGVSPVTVAFPALAIKRLKGVPVMFWVQDIWPETLAATGAVRSKKVLSLVDKMVRFIYKRCDLILIQSKAFFSHVTEKGVIAGKVKFLPNTAEELFRSMELGRDEPERAELPQGFKVIFAGNIGVAQDFPMIIDAAEILKEQKKIHWIIFGDGRMYPWVREQIDKRGLTKSVHLMGKRPLESMPRYFSLADTLLVTLKKDPIFALTIPAKMQSYLACARPIIAAMDGEGARIVEEAGAGITCAAESPGLLAKAVLKMYDLFESERQVMGARGRTYYDVHFKREKLLNNFEEMVKDLMGTKKEKELLCEKES